MEYCKNQANFKSKSNKRILSELRGIARELFECEWKIEFWIFFNNILMHENAQQMKTFYMIKYISNKKEFEQFASLKSLEYLMKGKRNL